MARNRRHGPEQAVVFVLGLVVVGICCLFWSLPSDAAITEQTVFGGFAVNRTERIVSDANGAEISLTNAEYRLLDFFLTRPNEIIARVDLLAEIGSDLTCSVDQYANFVWCPKGGRNRSYHKHGTDDEEPKTPTY